ncbi:hypothetical protein [Bacillus sp. 166amftsu]|uniref:hypothetical protein n=1 Tax=Bacillus sp. 166amftsu TaxID=1761753 RepID=UPI00089AE699|nr:hypothetical protein [Bacillus sp. 166amftsu]SDZ15613.1 hypothetical protein SAMN04488156_107141 [Bacillus sp. 166amftsu]
MRLEYRLNDEAKQYPALWNYADISVSEAVARMTCEYFVKEGDTYVVTATSMDPDGTAVLYVQKKTFFNDPSESTYSHIGFEIRELLGENSILIESKDVWNHDEIVTYLHSDILYVQKDGIFMEFTLDSREIDEDRKCYVYYGNFTGEHR